MTAKKAITIGQWTVNIPIFALIALLTFGTLYYAEQLNIEKWVTIIAFVVGGLLGWLYWIFAAPIWLAWAYEKVENQKELRYRAVLTKFALGKKTLG